MIIEFMLTTMFGLVFGLGLATVYNLGKTTGENEALVQFLADREVVLEIEQTTEEEI